MKKFGGFDEAKKAAAIRPGEKLPAGAYVCKILGVKYEEGAEGRSDMIVMQFDISEGEYEGFFKKQYDADDRDDKKYKGQTRIYVPTDDGSEKDGWTKRSFAGWINALEQSNNGYVWDWNEKKWKGKTLGIVFGETGALIEGRSVVFTEARFGVSADEVREGKAPAAKFKARSGFDPNTVGQSRNGSGNSDKSASDIVNDGFMAVSDAEDTELPF